MSGQCYGCGNQFGFFRKEHGCNQCGFSFCADCLRHKIAVPKQKNKVLRVCRNCHGLLTGKKKQESRPIEPPNAFVKRVEALERRPTATGSSVAHGSSTGNSGRRRPEHEIQERLNKLKADRANQKPLQSQGEIEARLAQLRDKDPTQTKQLSSLPVARKKLQAEEVDDLLAEMCDEVELDRKYNPVSQTQNRLDQLKGQGPTGAGGLSEPMGIIPGASGGSDKPDQDTDELQRLLAAAEAESKQEAIQAIRSLERDKEIQERLKELKDRPRTEQESDEDSETEEQATTRIVKQLQEEAELESRIPDVPRGKGGSLGRQKPNDIPRSEEEDEFPWCCICNDDATLRCRGCDNDLYCQRCFREGHETFCMQDHPTVAYRALNS